MGSLVAPIVQYLPIDPFYHYRLYRLDISKAETIWRSGCQVTYRQLNVKFFRALFATRGHNSKSFHRCQADLAGQTVSVSFAL